MKTPIRLWLLLTLLLPVFLPLASAAQGKESAPLAIRVGTYDNYPKIFVASDGKSAGFFPEILNHIAGREGWEIRYVQGNWSQCLERLETGDIDIMPDVAYSKERNQKFAFNTETALINWGGLYVGDDVVFRSLPDLAGKRVAVMDGSIHTDGQGGIVELLHKFNVPCRFIRVNSYREVFDLIDSGRAEAGVVNRIFGNVHQKAYQVKKTSFIFNPRTIKFAFPKNGPRTPELVRAIDRCLAELKNDPDSIYMRALEQYIAGQARIPGGRGKGVALEPAVFLTETEKSWIAAHPLIRFGADPEFVPFEYIAPDGTYQGIASEYVAILNRRLGLNLQLVPSTGWAQVMDRVIKGQIDVLPCIGKTADRKRFLRFSDPYLNFHRVIITRSAHPFISGLGDLADEAVAVQGNSSHDGFLKDYHPELDPVRYQTIQDALLAVSHGKADALVGNVASASFWIRKLNLTNLKVSAPVLPSIFHLHFGIRRDWPELAAIINKGLASITLEEENRIFRNWINVDYPTGIDPRTAWKYAARAGIPALVLIIGILAWNLTLKRQVIKRMAAEQRLEKNIAFEHLLSEMSSRFIALAPEALDENINRALADVAQFTESDVALLFDYHRLPDRFSCTHAAGPSGTDNGKLLTGHLDSDKMPWWADRMKQGEVVHVASLDALPAGADGLVRDLMARNVLSFIDVPTRYQNTLFGVLRICSLSRHRQWRRYEINLLNLVGETMTNALVSKQNQAAVARYAEELESANQRLKGLDRLKSMFIASMSHELRTPLNSIIGFSGVMLQGMSGPLSDKQTDHLSRVQQSARHLLDLITDVIDISKIEAGKIDVFPQSFPLTELVQEAVDSTRPLIDAKSLELTVSVPENLEVHTDRKRLLQAVINFVGNAAKYTETGSITITAEDAGDRLEIRVRDTGIGIDKADMPRLFEAFERFDSHLKIIAGGTGLGLYLTRKLVTDLLRGEVIVESEIGKGSVFGINIPKHLAAAPPGREEQQEKMDEARPGH